MGKYGEAAVIAVNLIVSGNIDNPREAWEISTANLFGKGTSSQRKGCPKSSFLGLCEEGKVKGVRPGHYTRSSKNKEYAIKALDKLKNMPELTKTPNSLWAMVLQGEVRKHNQQMDVVLSLWNSNLLERE